MTLIKGVNLGGWLVLEDWMTRSLFQGTDAVNEMELMRVADAAQRVTRHRDTFVTEEDFKWLRDHGMTHVRIPVGYWVFDSADGCLPARNHLDKAMVWAERYGIKVLICLHVARGAQNTYRYTGGHEQKAWFSRKDYRLQTHNLLLRVAREYRDAPAFWGLELLNEPQPGRRYFALLRFYRKAYSDLRLILKPGTHVVYHDAFNPIMWTGALWQRRQYPVMMDAHWYALPSPKWLPLSMYMRLASLLRRLALATLRATQPIVVGEWSTVLPQQYFDAVPKQRHMDLLEQNAAMQQRAYRSAAGWIYWNYKVEGEGMWNFRSLVENGHIKLK